MTQACSVDWQEIRENFLSVLQCDLKWLDIKTIWVYCGKVLNASGNNGNDSTVFSELIVGAWGQWKEARVCFQANSNFNVLRLYVYE